MIFDYYSESDRALAVRMFESSVLGLTSGSFDLLHPPHVAYLKACRQLCGQSGKLLVGVDSDYLVRKRKGSTRPIYPETDRLEMVSSLKCVDGSFILASAEDFGKVVYIFGVATIFKNQDYTDIEIFGADRHGTNVIIIPDFKRPHSTSQIIQEIISRSDKEE